MKNDDIYDAWKTQKSQIEVSKGFTDKVINQIYQYGQKKVTPLFDVTLLVEFISARLWAKAALIAAGALAGFVRIAFVVIAFLGNCTKGM